MRAVGSGLVGLIIGAVIGYMNRPTYFGGLLRSTPQDLAQGGQVLQDTLAVMLPFAVGGFLLFAVAGHLLLGKKPQN